MKPPTGKFINCLSCKKSFYIPINRFNTAKYCSKRCYHQSLSIQIVSICLICNKEFTHISCRANKAKYCSRKCYYKAMHLKGTVEYTCKHCNKKFLSSPSKNRKYCSKKCVNKSNKKIWKPSFTCIRERMKDRGLISKCSKCGYNKVTKILGIHHKDGNRKNNELSNLIVVCPTCHSLLHSKHIPH